MNVHSYCEEAVNDIGALVLKQIDGHKTSYIKYSELVALSKLGKYSLNGELREMCPLFDFNTIISGKNLIGYDSKKFRHYANLDETAQSILNNYGKNYQISQELPLINKEFDKWKLEEDYRKAQERPYVLSGIIAFNGSLALSSILLAYTLPNSHYVNTTAMAFSIGTVIGGLGWATERMSHPLGKILKPFEKLMMLDYRMEDMKGTSIYEENEKRQCIKKLSHHIKRNYIDIEMRA